MIDIVKVMTKLLPGVRRRAAKRAVDRCLATRAMVEHPEIQDICSLCPNKFCLAHPAQQGLPGGAKEV